jgi:hypothetical protein
MVVQAKCLIDLARHLCPIGSYVSGGAEGNYSQCVHSYCRQALVLGLSYLFDMMPESGILSMLTGCALLGGNGQFH